MKTFLQFVRKKWFLMLISCIVTYVIWDHDNRRDVDTYTKGGIIIALVSQGNVVNRPSALTDALENDHWIRNGRGKGICYQFIIVFNDEKGTYSLFGGPEKKTVLAFSSDSKDVFDWLQAIESFKCNTISM